MGRFASWLSARPTNAVLVMVVVFPLTPPVAGAVMLQQTLVHGWQGALLRGVLAVATLALAATIVGSGQEMAVMCAIVLGLAALLGVALQMTRSTTLTVQLVLLVAIVLIGALHATAADGTKIWTPLANNLRELLSAGQSPANDEFIALMMTMLHEIALIGIWLTAVIALYLGHMLYALMPGNDFEEGRFRDLNLGRLMAATMIVSCIVLAAFESPIARGIAMCLLVAFIVQGLALLHWFVARRGAGAGTLLAAYLALVLPFVNAIALPALSVVGYVDAWFGIRKQLPATS
ncbi:MAG: hypothetical protein AAFZ58_05750 [Pseudomonadota bacterium]